MEDPTNEISNVVKMLCTDVSADIQKAALERYFTPNASFQHPICSVARGPNSRDKILGIYQWYKIMAPHIDIDVNQVVYDEPSHKMYLTITQTMHFRFNPFRPKPATLLTIFDLTPTSPYLITHQTDYYQPESFFSLITPPVACAISYLKSFTTTVFGVNAYVGQLVLGVWKPQGEGKKD